VDSVDQTSSRSRPGRVHEQQPIPTAFLIAADVDPSVFWGPADAAELDVLVYGLVDWYFAHREACEACSPDPCRRYAAWLAHVDQCRICEGRAPLTFGWTCPERRRFLDEHRDCVRCAPCPHLQRAIAVVVEWRDVRVLLTRAEALRVERDRQVAR
jgi:hypothetical protein